jgi:hypothetical protein
LIDFQEPLKALSGEIRMDRNEGEEARREVERKEGER